jgi:tRNA threonylcarbamoyladenosine biosynthesis protein TsaE
VPLEHTRTSSSEAQTRDIGVALGGLLRPGDIVLLEGALGAGKTTLVRALAEGLGLDPHAVSSPTFVVVHDYRQPVLGAGRPDLIHVDAYRLAGAEELDTVGWDAAVARVQGPGASAALVVEWPERLGPRVLEGATPARVRLEHAGEHQREVFLSLPESWRPRLGVGDLLQRRPTTCPITGVPVPADSPTWPFANERARLADLHRWFSGRYTISRRPEQSDLEQDD